MHAQESMTCYIVLPVLVAAECLVVTTGSQLSCGHILGLPEIPLAIFNASLDACHQRAVWF